jgi:hypothetical protein
MIRANDPVCISRQEGAGGWYSHLERCLPSTPLFQERMESRRAQLSGSGRDGYSRTTGDLLRYQTLDEAIAGIDRRREESVRPEGGYDYGWSKERCEARDIYTSPERTLDPQERAVRGLQSDALYFGLGATAGARPLFDYLKTGELTLPEDQAGDPAAASGAVASAVNARLHRASYGVATATRDRIFTRAAPSDVPGERFSLEGVGRPR